MSAAQEIFALTFDYLPYMIPVIFTLAVLASVDLIYTFLINVIGKVKKHVRIY